MEKTESLVNAPELPAHKLIAHSLINELDQIPENCIVVLDDYHLIRNESIHQLIDELLHYPPENLHLCMLTRRDPPLRIKNLRAHNRMYEIRMGELTFTEDEIIGLFKMLHGITLEKTTAASLQKRTEGWITALQLVSLASKNKTNIENELASFSGDLYMLSDFLIEEILSGLSNELKELLFSTALLDGFCLELIKACRMVIEKDNNDESKTEKLFDQLINSNLFLIPLDDERKWFRYHHLFQKILVNHLGPGFDAEGIKSIHYLAARWFEDEGLIDEAIDHFLAAGDINAAAELVEKHAHNEFLYNVFRVEEWQKKLPLELKEQRPRLLLIDAWIAYRQLHMERVPPLLDKIDLIFKNKSQDQQLLAEINFFHGNFLYWMGAAKETDICINMLKQALVHADKMPVHALSNIELLLNMALQKNGEKETLIPALENQILTMDNSNGYRLAFIYGSLTFVNLLCGNLMQAKKISSQMQIFTANIGAGYLRSWSIYMHALANFHLFEVSEAKDYFKQVIERGYSLDRRVVIDTMAARALLHQFKGEDELANLSIDAMMKYSDETNDLQIHFVAKSAQIRLAILQGNYDLAFKWAETFTEHPIFFGLFFWQEVPWITLVKVFIAKGTPESLQKAEEILSTLYDIVASSHFDCQLVEINLLLSITLQKMGQKEASMEKLKAAVLQAEVYGFVRPFIEAGKSAIELLNSLKDKTVAVDFIQELGRLITKASHQKTTSPKHDTEVSEKIIPTERELEILYLLSEGLRNKEIANKLFVSEGTIKKHVYNMGQKFDTNSRVDLINKARSAGFIQNV